MNRKKFLNKKQPAKNLYVLLNHIMEKDKSCIHVCMLIKIQLN